MGDPGRTRAVYVSIVLLVLLGGGLVAVAIWLFRRTRAEPELLGPLEAMGRRSWRRTAPATRQQLLDAARPAGATPLGPGAATDGAAAAVAAHADAALAELDELLIAADVAVEVSLERRSEAEPDSSGDDDATASGDGPDAVGSDDVLSDEQHERKPEPEPAPEPAPAEVEASSDTVGDVDESVVQELEDGTAVDGPESPIVGTSVVEAEAGEPVPDTESEHA